ncbi:MAG: ATP-dependent DNA helicase RecG [Treponemataceae bacterium]
MFLRELDAPVTHIKGAGPSVARTLANLGVTNVGQLLSRYPRDWEDRSVETPLRDFARGGEVNTIVTVLAHDWFGFGRMKTLKIHIEDDTSRAVLICFNRPFLENQAPVGGRFRLWGRFFFKYGEIQSTAFELEPIREATETDAPPTAFGVILPIYSLSAGLTQGTLRRLVKRAIADYALRVEDELPRLLREREGFPTKAKAISAIHFPASLEELETAKRTLIYEELFYLETLVGKRALERRTKKRTQAPDGPISEGLSPLQSRLIERLPFKLTDAQTSAIAEIDRDMSSEYPMARLLQGDVGSGKTLVAFFAALRAVDLGGQAAILAPTELLARQHAENAARLLEPLGVNLAFLTGNVKAAGRAQLLGALAEGRIDIVVGTHALFSKDVTYHALRLVVVDEQHRFGVVQRAAIMAKGDIPDLLMMSATPIPRTLALTVFGDLDVSVIKELPPGRKPIKTHLAQQGNEQKVYEFVRKELSAGRQAYFVYPLIDSSSASDLKDAETWETRLRNKIFPERKVALVHSKRKEDEKRETMEAFRKAEIDVLVATSVVEVGVDVPNASCMVIEHAERFGLSALHQLRGRVGRGEGQSYCFLVYSKELTEDGKARLKVMLENSDGFVIAEEDLKLRGPGQIAGIEQSGYLALGIADPVRDSAILAQARVDAFAILKSDPGLLENDHRVIAAVLERAPPFGTVVA